jgi:small subunit ribosomal protein S18
MPPRRRPSEGDVTVVDINNPDFLNRFVTEQGKILPQRLSGLSAKQQRKLKLGVRRARTMGQMM